MVKWAAEGVEHVAKQSALEAFLMFVQESEQEGGVLYLNKDAQTGTLPFQVIDSTEQVKSGRVFEHPGNWRT